VCYVSTSLIRLNAGVISFLSDAFWDTAIGSIRVHQMDIGAFDRCRKYDETKANRSVASLTTARVVVSITGSSRSSTLSADDVPRSWKYFHQFNVSELVLAGHVIGNIAIDDLPPGDSTEL